ncbi:hypothetical protein J31TS4_26950 [Paenibacillus sp. J31TS4]|uniref:hypothetical protein n=1 Tax=Paenibacillus sp. J31TS4 TaxID=2807195 RepID=UPI001B22A2A4|nr:hypothetical protein [Paenibacillus sp. J31TS4]GIP39415.1 hypothetical protein J31TS4_26950 [Paenibacillus sp. J31TS4]
MNRLPVLLLLSLVFLLSGCSFLPVRPTQGQAIIDWVDFVKLNGHTYTSVWNRALADPKLVGEEAGHVNFKVADVVTDPYYRTQDGDAAFLGIGTKLYRVEGFSKEELLAAPDPNQPQGYRLYATEGAVQRASSIFDDLTANRISRIELYADYWRTPPFRTLVQAEKDAFFRLLASGLDSPGYSPFTQSGDPAYTQMVLYTGEPLAYTFSLADDGRHVFFHPQETRLVDNAIRAYLQQP